MNRFIKNVLIAAAVCLAAGLLMCGCAAAMGGTLPGSGTGNRLAYGGWMKSLAGRIAGSDLFRKAANREDGPYEERDGDLLVSVYPSGGIREFKIVAAPSRIVIREGQTDGPIRVERTSDRIVLSDELSGDSLKLTFENGKGIVNLPEGEAVSITIPKGCSFRKAELEASAASIDADRLAADELDISSDAASVTVGSVTAEKLKLDAAVGNIEILDGSVGTLEAESAMGSVTYTGAAEDSVEADCEMGSIVFTIDGAAEDFNYKIERSIGSIVVEGLLETEKGVEEKRTIRHDGAGKTAGLKCDMGSVEMYFR